MYRNALGSNELPERTVFVDQQAHELENLLTCYSGIFLSPALPLVNVKAFDLGSPHDGVDSFVPDPRQPLTEFWAVCQVAYRLLNPVRLLRQSLQLAEARSIAACIEAGPGEEARAIEQLAGVGQAPGVGVLVLSAGWKQAQKQGNGETWGHCETVALQRVETCLPVV
jgi:hypothetical protein